MTSGYLIEPPPMPFLQQVNLIKGKEIVVGMPMEDEDPDAAHF